MEVVEGGVRDGSGRSGRKAMKVVELGGKI
jgi:hypothetical protein